MIGSYTFHRNARITAGKYLLESKLHTLMQSMQYYDYITNSTAKPANMNIVNKMLNAIPELCNSIACKFVTAIIVNC